MSWGERSCVHSGRCPIPGECSMSTCNVDCRMYEWDRITRKDSVPVSIPVVFDDNIGCLIRNGKEIKYSESGIPLSGVSEMIGYGPEYKRALLSKNAKKRLRRKGKNR